MYIILISRQKNTLNVHFTNLKVTKHDYNKYCFSAPARQRAYTHARTHAQTERTQYKHIITQNTIFHSIKNTSSR